MKKKDSNCCFVPRLSTANKQLVSLFYTKMRNGKSRNVKLTIRNIQRKQRRMRKIVQDWGKQPTAALTVLWKHLTTKRNIFI